MSIVSASLFSDFFDAYHRMSSEEIIRAARNLTRQQLLEAIRWGVKTLEHADTDAQVALELGLIKAACDVWMVALCQPEPDDAA